MFVKDPTCEEVGKCTYPAFVTMADGTITAEAVTLPFVATVCISLLLNPRALTSNFVTMIS